MQEAACLHKEMIVQRKEQKKSAIETEKILDLYASKCNDQLLEKSINDYQSMITSKEKRNQLIMQAQRDRTIRNFSTVEHERNLSLEQLVK